MWYEPNGDYGKPDIFVTLPNVLSGTYKFYVVFMPSSMEELGRDKLKEMSIIDVEDMFYERYNQC